MLIYALDATHLTAKRGAEIAPPSNDVVVDTLSLDAPHDGAPEKNILVTLSNIANTYQQLGRHKEALRMRRAVYTGTSKPWGEQHSETLHEASNYSVVLAHLGRFEEAKALVRKTMPAARRVLGESNEHTLRLRWIYAMALYGGADATLDDLREAVETCEDMERIARRVMGGAHPLVNTIEVSLKNSREALHAREKQSGSA